MVSSCLIRYGSPAERTTFKAGLDLNSAKGAKIVRYKATAGGNPNLRRSRAGHHQPAEQQNHKTRRFHIYKYTTKKKRPALKRTGLHNFG